jgi:hypothetical protein
MWVKEWQSLWQSTTNYCWHQEVLLCGLYEHFVFLVQIYIREREYIRVCRIYVSRRCSTNVPQPQHRDEQFFSNFIDEWKAARGNKIWNLSSPLLPTIFGMLIYRFLERDKIMKEVIKNTMFLRSYDPV